MDKKVFKKSGLPVRKTVDLLPEVFKSPANDKFLSATLDALVQPGSLERLTGYIGRTYGKTYNTNDVYLDVEKSLRYAYQLEPGVAVTENNRTSKFYDYIDFKNQQKFFGDLYEIRSAPNQIVVNAATVNDVEVIQALTSTNLRTAPGSGVI